jgi:hypothetical protein
MSNTTTASLSQGCEDPDVARQRAAMLVGIAFGFEPTYWTSRAEQLLAALLSTAAYAGCEPDVLVAAIATTPDGSDAERTVRAVATRAWVTTVLAAA